MSPLNPVDVSVAPRRGPAWQFRLRTLMGVMAGCSAVLATMVYLGPYWSLAISLVGIMVGAHVAGNVLGTSLRAGSTGRPVHRGQPPSPAVTSAAKPRLQDRSRLDRLAAVCTLAGAAGGVLVGRLLFAAVDQGQLTLADWLLGLASFAVIAGWLGLMASSFVRIGCLPVVACYFQRVPREPDLGPGTESGGAGPPAGRRDGPRP